MTSLVLLKIYILMAIVDKMEGHVLGLAWQIRKLAGEPDPAFQYLQRWMDSCQGICDRVSWIGGETYDEDNEVLSYRYFIFFEDKQVGLSELAKKLQRMMDETGMVYGDACDELWPPWCKHLYSLIQIHGRASLSVGRLQCIPELQTGM